MPAVSAQAHRIQLESIALRVTSGPDAGLEVSFCLPTLKVGSADDNDLILSDRAVSRHHAEICMTLQGSGATRPRLHQWYVHRPAAGY